jgi:NAD(P)H-nitrite reductase large subunit
MTQQDHNDDDMIVCRCEEVTVGEIRKAIGEGARDLDSVKRMTRAGAGLCQCKTCYNLVASLLHAANGTPRSELHPFTVRPPVRPVPVNAWPERTDGSTPAPGPS